MGTTLHQRRLARRLLCDESCYLCLLRSVDLYSTDGGPKNMFSLSPVLCNRQLPNDCYWQKRQLWKILLNDLNRLGKNISKRKNSGNLRNNSKQPFVEISEEYLKMNLWPELTIQSWNTVILKKWKELSTYCKCMSGRTLDTFGVRRAILYLIKF